VTKRQTDTDSKDTRQTGRQKRHVTERETDSKDTREWDRQTDRQTDRVRFFLSKTIIIKSVFFSVKNSLTWTNTFLGKISKKLNYNWFPVLLSFCLSFCLSFYLSVCPPVCLSELLPIHFTFANNWKWFKFLKDSITKIIA